VTSQPATLYSGPGNINYKVLAELPTGTALTLEGVYGDFVRADVVTTGGEATGFIWKEVVQDLPEGLPLLDSLEVPWEPMYLPECVPGYDPGANSVTITPTPTEIWGYDMESAPWSLTNPVRIHIGKLSGQGVVKVLGSPEGGESINNWWQGMTRMTIGINAGNYSLQILVGRSSLESATIDLNQSASLPIQLVFDQPEGKSFVVLDGNGNELKAVDLATWPDLHLEGGLFPQRVFYFGTTAYPNSSLEVTGLTVEQQPLGRWITGTALNAYLDGPGLAGLANDKPIMGTMFELNRMIDRRYCQIMERSFDDVTVSPYWGGLWLGRDQYDFGPLDRIVEYARQRGWRVLLSHLVWGTAQDIPQWLRDLPDSITPQEYSDILHEHISAVMTHFEGRVQEWSIANEVAERSVCEGFDEFWYGKLGEGYIRKAFEWARQLDPDGILILNSGSDYPPFRTRCSQDTLKRMDEILANLNGGGHLVDAVGMQMHLLFPYDTQVPPQKDEVIQTMQKFAAAGVKIYITEFEVDIGSQLGTQEENQAFQAQVYRDMMDACLGSGVCANFTVWGFADSLSWSLCHNQEIPICWDESNGNPLMFDKDFLPKPAYFAVRDTLAGITPTAVSITLAPRPEPRQAIADCLAQLPAAPSAPGETPGGYTFAGLNMVDDFGNNAYDGSFDPSKWNLSSFPDTLIEPVAFQQAGRLGIALGGTSTYGSVNLNANNFGNFTLNAANAFEAQLAICPASSTGQISIAVQSNLQAGGWTAGCTVNRYSSRYRELCSDSIWPLQDGHSFSTPWQTIDAGTWHALRIEIDPATMIITYFIDGTVVGRHKPSDADELQAKPFHFNINIWKSGVDSPVVGLVDNVRIGHIVQFEHGGSLALGKPVTASSSEGSNYPVKYAVDGDPATSWSSGFSDPQWIQVDLGAVYPVRRVVLNWEASYAVKYEIQISSDGSTWETVYSTTSGDGGMDDLSVSGSGHYVRMAGTSRAVIDGNSYGYSLYEFEVYGAP
jgi:GH35 family endo-1,4-beta-xylanase